MTMNLEINNIMFFVSVIAEMKVFIYKIGRMEYMPSRQAGWIMDFPSFHLSVIPNLSKESY